MKLLISRACLVAAACVLLVTSVSNAETTQQRKKKIQEIETQATPRAVERKRRSDELLRGQGVPVNKNLPPIEDETQVEHRTVEEIAYRALAVLTVSMKGDGLDEGTLKKIIADYGLEGRFTPDELKFIRDPQPSAQERSRFSWRYEAAWALFWSIGYVDELGKPASPCNVDAMVQILLKRRPAQFFADAKLRPLADIVEQADRIYRYHWAVVDARLNGKSSGGLDADVTVEWHYALNWLIGYMDAEWDDISTDT